jgi:glycosyltransferase involved in cell wall biosynthesis
VRVLHLTSDWKWTGPAEPMLHGVCGLRARGHAADVAFPVAPPGNTGALDERARERGLVPVLELARARGYRPLRDRAEVRRLHEALLGGRYDVVHTHHTRDHLLARLAVRGTRARLVASWHRGHPIPTRSWNRLRLGPRGAHGLAVLSHGIAEQARTGLGWPAERVGVLPGVVDTQVFAPRDAPLGLRAELGLEPEARVLGIVARLQPHRRYELLLEAFRRAHSEAPALRLVVVGRGTRAREVLEAPVARLGLADAVVQAGYRRDDFRDVMALFDSLVFLVPGSDGSCRAVLEAMAMGIPTITSRRELLPEIVEDGVTGVLVDEDPDRLSEAFLGLWREPERAAARGKAARERALARYRVELHAERLERFYSGLVDSEPASGLSGALDSTL